MWARPDASEAIERFCTHIRNALRRAWVSPEERREQEEAAVQRLAETERLGREVGAKRRADEEAGQQTAEEKRRERETEAEQRRKVEAEAKSRADEEQRQRGARGGAKASGGATAESREDERLRTDAEARRRAEEEERRRLRRSKARPLWPPSRPVLMASSLFGLAALAAIGVWIVIQPQPPAPAPIAPTLASNIPLSTEQERALKPKDTFKECTNCPEMVVVPAGTFKMGSPANEPGRDDDEGAQHTVTLARQFAVGKFALTFDEWDACAADGGCNGYKPDNLGWGRGRQPVIEVSLGRRPAIRRVAVQDDRQGLSSAFRGRVRICDAGGDADGLSVGELHRQVGELHRQEQRQLRQLWQPVGRQTNRSGWFVRSKPVRSL